MCLLVQRSLTILLCSSSYFVEPWISPPTIALFGGSRALAEKWLLRSADLEVFQIDNNLPSTHENSLECADDADHELLLTSNITHNNVSFFYLKNDLGLSEESMWRITFDAPSALGMTAHTIRRKVHLLQETMNLTNPELRVMLEKAPAILHLSADKNIAPTIVYLLRLLDLSRQELKDLLLACPSILGYNKDNLKAKVHFFTELMGYTVPETRTLLLKQPNLMRSSVRTGLIPRFRFLTHDVGLSRDKLRDIILQNPRILLYSLDQNLVPKLIFFCIMTLHMEASHVERLLTAYPPFLDYNLDRHTLPIARYFLQDLEFNPIELRSLVLTYPRIVTNALPKIKYTVGFLRYEMGLSGSQVKRVLYQAPQVLGLRDDNLRAKIQYLRDALGFDDDDNDSEVQCGELQSLIAGMPRLLVLNVERNLKPKIEFLKEAFDGDMTALRRAVLRLPTLLGYSLDKRIRPRMADILQEPAPLDPGMITVGIPMQQAKFESWLARRKAQATAQAKSKMTPNRPRARETVECSTPSARTAPQRPDGITHWTRDRIPRT